MQFKASVISLLYIANSTLPSKSANSIHVMKMAQALAGCGVRVALVGRGTEASIPPERIMAMYGVAPRFALDLDSRRWPFLENTRYATRAAFKARREKTDLVYTRVPRAAFLAELFGIPAVLELHRPLRDRDVRLYLRRARAPLIVAISEALRRQIIADLGCDPSRVIVAHDGADPMPENVAPILPALHDGRLRVGYLGSLGPGKGMEIIAQIAPYCPWADFEIVGGSIEAIAGWREQLGRLGNIHFCGHQPHAATPGYLASFDVALLPNQKAINVSHGGAVDISPWTSPLKAFEYMAAGLPIIFSDQDNLKEIFTAGADAIACPPDDPGAWIAALQSLRNDPALRGRLGATAARTFNRKFTWSRRAQMLLDAIATHVLSDANN